MRSEDFRIVAAQFQQLTGLALEPRRANRLEHRTDRVDRLFQDLSDVAFTNPELLDVLWRCVPGWLERADCATVRALAGYVAYCREDWPRAVNSLLSTIAMEPDNLDTWIDLAFALNHAGDPLGRDILYDFAELIPRFAATGSRVCTLGRLRAIRDEIHADGVAYAQTWRSYLPG